MENAPHSRERGRNRSGSLTTATRENRREGGKASYIKCMTSGSRMLGSRNSERRMWTLSAAGKSK